MRSSGALNEIEGLSKKSKLVNERLTRYLQQHAPIAVFIPPFYGTIVDEEMRAKVVIDRLLGSGDQSHVVRNPRSAQSRWPSPGALRSAV